jgi:hypothetical protein
MQCIYDQQHLITGILFVTHHSMRHPRKKKKATAKKNKLGVTNSLVNNINARKKKGISRSKKKKTVSKKSYKKMQHNWQ